MQPEATPQAPTISIVTPSLDQGAFIESTLLSVISQGCPHLEYVVIDGGSSDGSIDIIERHQRDLAYWVSEPDRGHADAVNKGFARTSGQIMGWINSSDVYYPWTLETVRQIFIDLPHVEWITGLPTEVASSAGPKGVGRSFHNKYDFLAGDYRWIQQESVFWRRSLWDRAGGGLDDSLRYAADFELWLRFFRLAELHHVTTILGGYRVHGDRLGAADQYRPQAALLMDDYAARENRRTLHRARVIRAAGARYGQNVLLEKVFRKLGVCRWYRHQKVIFDFDTQRWVVL